jgi:3-hydroxybutyryl-CoA dehydratase
MNHFNFSEMIAGKKESMEVQVGEREIAAFAELSGDVSPIHVDDAFAKSKGFNSRIAHGALLVSYVSRFIGTILPGANGLLQSVAIEFRRPCYPGTKIKIEGEVAKRVESVRVVRITILVTDSVTGEILATGLVQSGITD